MRTEFRALDLPRSLGGNGIKETTLVTPSFFFGFKPQMIDSVQNFILYC